MWLNISNTTPYTHHTILAPHCRFGIWPTDHVVLFPIFSSISVTQCILSWANQSQAIAPRGQGLTICFTTHKPCAHFYLSFVFETLVPWKRRKFFPQNSDLSLFCLIILPCSTSYLCLTSYIWFTLHSHTILTLHFPPPCTPHDYARSQSLTPRSHPQSHIELILRSLALSILVAS